MPELPDLEVFSLNLTRRLKNKKVKQVSVPVPTKLNCTVAELQKSLTGKTLKSVYRDGKELFFGFSNDDVLALHLMLHGKLVIDDTGEDVKHAVLSLLFTDGQQLTLTDWQRAATPTLNPEPKEAPDALSKSIDYAFLKSKLSGKRKVKDVLMDQKVIRGIGNAYADEIFWDAKIDPFSIAHKIPDARIKALAKSIPKVLNGAMKAIRKADPDIIAGEIRDFLPIHNARKKASPGGAAIKIKPGARKTYYTDEQVLYS